MMHNTRDLNDQYAFWRRFFIDQGIQVIEISPDQHDKLAAKTQGVTHFLGRMLKEFGIQKTTIDTQGFRDLLDLFRTLKQRSSDPESTDSEPDEDRDQRSPCR